LKWISNLYSLSTNKHKHTDRIVNKHELFVTYCLWFFMDLHFSQRMKITQVMKQHYLIYVFFVRNLVYESLRIVVAKRISSVIKTE